MYRNSYQTGLLTVFNSGGSSPLGNWGTCVENGHIKAIKDNDVKCTVLELTSTNIENTYIYCPKAYKSLGVHLPFLVLITKNLRRYFSFEVQILDDANIHRRFRISNYQSSTRISMHSTSMPITLANGWNQIQFNLADFTRRAYNTSYIECSKITIHANARVKRIYFCTRLYDEDELPREYKLFLPIQSKSREQRIQKATKPVATVKSEHASLNKLFEAEEVKAEPEIVKSSSRVTFVEPVVAEAVSDIASTVESVEQLEQVEEDETIEEDYIEGEAVSESQDDAANENQQSVEASQSDVTEITKTSEEAPNSEPDAEEIAVEESQKAVEESSKVAEEQAPEEASVA